MEVPVRKNCRYCQRPLDSVQIGTGHGPAHVECFYSNEKYRPVKNLMVLPQRALVNALMQLLSCKQLNDVLDRANDNEQANWNSRAASAKERLNEQADHAASVR